MPEEYISFDQAAEALGVSRDELKKLVDSAAIRSFRDAGEIKFRAADLQSYKQKVATSSSGTGDDEELLFLSDEDSAIIEEEDTSMTVGGPGELGDTLELATEGEDTGSMGTGTGTEGESGTGSEPSIEVASEASAEDSLFDESVFDISPLDEVEDSTAGPVPEAQVAEAIPSAEPAPLATEQAPSAPDILAGIEEEVPAGQAELREIGVVPKVRRPKVTSPVATALFLVSLVILAFTGIFYAAAAVGYPKLPLVSFFTDLLGGQ